MLKHSLCYGRRLICRIRFPTMASSLTSHRYIHQDRRIILKPVPHRIVVEAGHAEPVEGGRYSGPIRISRPAGNMCNTLTYQLLTELRRLACAVSTTIHSLCPRAQQVALVEEGVKRSPRRLYRISQCRGPYLCFHISMSALEQARWCGAGISTALEQP